MQRITIASAALAAVAAASDIFAQENLDVIKELEQWKKSQAGKKAIESGFVPKPESNGRQEASTSVEALELERFKSTKKVVEQLNKDYPDAEFSVDNPFALMTEDEFAQYVMGSFGQDQRKLRTVDHVARELTPAQREASDVDWSSHKCNEPIKNQGECGSCWTFSSIGVASSRSGNSEMLRYLMGPRSFASLLVVLDRASRCSAAFVSLLWSHWSRSTEYERAFVDNPPSVSPALQALVTAHFVSAAPTLAQSKGEVRDVAPRRSILGHQSTLGRRQKLPRLGPTANALLVLATMAPDAISAFTTAWLSALPADFDTSLELLYPIVTWIDKKLRCCRGSTVEHLTTECLARLRATRAPATLEPAHEMADIAIDPAHCAECHGVAAFLRDGKRAHLDLQLSSWRLCSNVRECVSANPDRLTMPKRSALNTEGILKLPPLAGVSLADYTSTQNDLAHIDHSIATLESMLADATRPAAKRPRYAFNFFA
ncbi:hypothetical protein SDRG_16347 [Saprolegnia diclina VS20]|uniref:Peptidase C1A papain C-terminal domain-containing protein n=1 Tax=Saprolegnia diclina (strain VS20) TaxID=1156394 RepID=T0PXP2_SAPDV|nr:hypothetical protein SDRG_16347 [Saprolegnia diclina VS20]EQC25800.1 hypothetical protein SDRG_16347 [Saprolegnia diclina VS20]|eukprot:XP_008620775.1 hypothetical protein SDRG_16347 [Saprolegnia diclina VS20]